MASKETFQKEVLELESNLSKYAYSLTMNAEDAKDLVQETFFKAFNNQEKFNEHTSIKAWTYTIMKNTFINDYRKRVKKEAVFSSDIHEYVINNKPSNFDPESDMGFIDIINAVESLDIEFKVPFKMFDDGYKYNEIADELGICLGTVKSRIHVSRKKLTKILESGILEKEKDR